MIKPLKINSVREQQDLYVWVLGENQIFLPPLPFPHHRKATHQLSSASTPHFAARLSSSPTRLACSTSANMLAHGVFFPAPKSTP
jgi:hypothetical protein